MGDIRILYLLGFIASVANCAILFSMDLYYYMFLYIICLVFVIGRWLNPWGKMTDLEDIELSLCSIKFLQGLNDDYRRLIKDHENNFKTLSNTQRLTNEAQLIRKEVIRLRKEIARNENSIESIEQCIQKMVNNKYKDE